MIYESVQIDRFLKKLNDDFGMKRKIYFMSNRSAEELLDKFAKDKPTLHCTMYNYNVSTLLPKENKWYFKHDRYGKVNVTPFNIETLEEQDFILKDIDKDTIYGLLEKFFNTQITKKHLLIIDTDCIDVHTNYKDYISQFIKLFENFLCNQNLSIIIRTRLSYLRDISYFDDLKKYDWEASELCVCDFIYSEENLPTSIGKIIRSSLLKKCYPSNAGLYPNEILVLGYAEKHYVNQDKFYKFWQKYYMYDVRDTLNKLEKLKLIEVGTKQLKKGDQKIKYQLTEKGKQELKDNEYVLLLHRNELGVISEDDLWCKNISDDERRKILDIDEKILDSQNLTPEEENIIQKIIQFEMHRKSIWKLNQMHRGNTANLNEIIERDNMHEIEEILNYYKEKSIAERYTSKEEPEYRNTRYKFQYDVCSAFNSMAKFLLSKNSVKEAVQYLFASNILEISTSICPYVITNDYKICVKSDELELDTSYFTGKNLNEIGKKNIAKNISKEIIEYYHYQIRDINDGYYALSDGAKVASLMHKHNISIDDAKTLYNNEQIRPQCFPIEYYIQLLKSIDENDLKSVKLVYKKIAQYYCSLEIDFQYIDNPYFWL